MAERKNFRKRYVEKENLFIIKEKLQFKIEENGTSKVYDMKGTFDKFQSIEFVIHDVHALCNFKFKIEPNQISLVAKDFETQNQADIQTFD